MRCLITGGAGFIGSHLAERLAGRGHHVVVLDNLSTGRVDWLNKTLVRAGTAGQAGAAGAVTLVEGSVTDRELVFNLVAGVDYVFHLASVVGVRLAMARGRETLRVSCLGTQNLLEAVTEHSREVLLASSSAIYGKLPGRPVREEDDSLLGATSRPSWLYSVAKLVEEHLGLAYAREAGTRVKVARFFNVIGPRQTGAHGMVVPNLVRRALRDEPLLVYGDGRQTRTFVYVDDALDGLDLVVGAASPGSVHNIGGTEEVTILELAERVKTLTGSASHVVLVPYKEAFGDDFEETRRRIPDISRLRALGYAPRYSLDEALRRVILSVTGQGGAPERS